MDKYQEFVSCVSHFISSERVILDELRRLALGADASCYRMIPKVILLLDSEDELIRVLQLARQLEIAVTFRAAGTSLSGQGVTDSVLLKLTPRWRHHKIIDQGSKVQVEPGLIGAKVNQLLAPFKRKIGPDPASINTCKIGGIAANNASGMCCGTAQNSYSTLAAMRLVLADGAVLDTSDSNSVAQFRISHKYLLNELAILARATKKDAQLRSHIEHKFRLKNTTGYSINALIDFDDPIDILVHLLIGSEGTLGFISNITYNTIALSDFSATGLFVFKDLETTCHCVSALKHTSVAAVELMDRASLAAIADKPNMPAFLTELGSDAAALLVEIQGETQSQLDQQLAQLSELIAQFGCAYQVPFSQDKALCEQLWAIRKGLFPAVGAVRETGTTVIIEDIAVPVAQLAAATLKLQSLLRQHGYHEAIIFGHALDGNLHFVFTQNFDNPEQIERYQEFMQAVVELVALEYNGSLKAEHGTGRNMAPFVELEWGKQAYRLMWEIKNILDPNNMLNPGVVLNEDPNAHLQHLKAMPKAEQAIDKCIECGFCEPVCPSKEVTLTPRQRIVLWREIQSRRQQGQSKQQLAPLLDSYQYQGIDTCAATGRCAQRCPIGIDTGEFIKGLRAEQVKAADTINIKLKNKLADWSANHFATTTTLVKQGLSLAQLGRDLLGEQGFIRISQTLNHSLDHHMVKWSKFAPLRNNDPVPSRDALASNSSSAPCVVYFPSCSSRVMGTDRLMAEQGEQSLMTTTIALLEKAGYQVIIPRDCEQLCCGIAFNSKGYIEQAARKADQLEQALLDASNQGQYPIYIDSSSCALTAISKRNDQLKHYDPIEFLADFVAPKLTITPLKQSVMLHITCSSRKLGLADKMHQLVAQCAEQVIIPADIECCGFAGDKGLFYPELNQAALADLKSAVPADCQLGVSSNRSCEIGLSEHSGISYKGVVYLLNQVSQAK
ncbi:FAD-binding and (Fe-S)-binding domain-containing protein [Motilimonas sp. KMU-193]|uniref:FAD-binding and (Fe-S)-binding domain-containing protein n=1 Tax=Motilimonas sp. KMU-193 TaxID=3388668 RepID=UPI00396B0A0B